ncbi:hypothetical protein M513_11712 [Trichuris suis]|uniref:Uncharacterized protein n=1 Tax=Trichuris suis TaxID=68888 RepID=A0A085LR05_9BILA|nr:hypothetical protein M513_11712 [Trichuris suis]
MLLQFFQDNVVNGTAAQCLPGTRNVELWKPDEEPNREKGKSLVCPSHLAMSTPLQTCGQKSLRQSALH